MHSLFAFASFTCLTYIQPPYTPSTFVWLDLFITLIFHLFQVNAFHSRNWKKPGVRLECCRSSRIRETFFLKKINKSAMCTYICGSVMLSSNCPSWIQIKHNWVTSTGISVYCHMATWWCHFMFLPSMGNQFQDFFWIEQTLPQQGPKSSLQTFTINKIMELY